MKILVIEDEENIAKLIKIGLEKEGYVVDLIADGIVGLRRIEVYYKNYDLVILDLMLPGKDGFEICRDVRGQGIDIPILVLTARNFIDDKISALDKGADDYLTKPFEFKELLARVRAILRRPKESSLISKLSVGNLSLNPITRKVYIDKKEVKLTLKEFGLLEYMMRHPNRVLTRDEIIFNMWDFNSESFSNFVDVHINNLRKKLEKKRNKKIFESVRGIGYLMRDDF